MTRSLTILTVSLVLLFCGLPAMAQTLIDSASVPANTADFGVGIQGGSNLNGTAVYCHLTTSTEYLCAAHKYSGSTTASTARIKQVVYAQKGFIASITADAGVATGADSGTGGAFAVGGVIGYNVSRLKFLNKFPNYWISAMADWDKRDVNEFVSATSTTAGIKAALRPFVTKGAYAFTIGKSW